MRPNTREEQQVQGWIRDSAQGRMRAHDAWLRSRAAKEDRRAYPDKIHPIHPRNRMPPLPKAMRHLLGEPTVK